MLKSCPKCRGDMVVDRDFAGVFRVCLQCGYLMDLAPKTAPAYVPAQAAAPQLRDHMQKPAA